MNDILETPDLLTQFLFKAKIMDLPVKELTGKVVMIAVVLAVMMFFINLAYNYISTAIRSLKDKSADYFVDYEEIARTLVVIGCIVIYLPMVETAINFGEFFNSLTAPATEQSKLLAKYSERYVQEGKIMTADVKTAAYQEILKSNDPSISPELRNTAELEVQKAKDEEEAKLKGGDVEIKEGDQAKKEGGYNWMNLLNPSYYIQMMLSGILLLATELIKPIITGLATGILKILVVIGPLAFAFSIVPAFKKQIEVWAGTCLTLLFVFTTINIIDQLKYASFYYLFHGETEIDAISQHSYMAYQIVLFIMYTMSFWLTSKVIGKGDAGRVISKIVGLAALAGAAAMSGGAAAGAAQGSAAADAAKAGANAIGDDGA